MLIGCGFASRASRGLRPRSLGRRTVGYGDPWKSLTRDSVGRFGALAICSGLLCLTRQPICYKPYAVSLSSHIDCL